MNKTLRHYLTHDPKMHDINHSKRSLQIFEEIFNLGMYEATHNSKSLGLNEGVMLERKRSNNVINLEDEQIDLGFLE